MFKLDNEFLTSLGLGTLPVDEKNKLLQHIYERLEMNVGMRLAEKMSDQQLDEFESFIDRNDEAGALKWLETNFPNYKEVVAEELEKLKQEVSQAAPQILAAAQSAPVPPQPVQQPFTPQQPAPQAYNPENPLATNGPEFAAGPAPGQFQQYPQGPQPGQFMNTPNYQQPAPQPYAPQPGGAPPQQWQPPQPPQQQHDQQPPTAPTQQ